MMVVFETGEVNINTYVGSVDKMGTLAEIAITEKRTDMLEFIVEN